MAYFELAFYSIVEGWQGCPFRYTAMFDDLTWDTILQAWPWFGAAAVVFVVAAGLLIALKPKPKRQPETAADAADKMGWALTGRIDLADPQSVGALVLEVEETRISMSPAGVEHREIRWRRATLPEAKMVLESYHAQQNLAMSATFAATAPAGTKREVNEQAESAETELKNVGNGHDMADVTLVPRDVTR
jgi:hypothetical protein